MGKNQKIIICGTKFQKFMTGVTSNPQEAITNKEDMKTIQELQQETAEKFDMAKTLFTNGGLYSLLDYPPHDMVLDEVEVKKFMSNAIQSAYDLGCEVTMERVREWAKDKRVLEVGVDPRGLLEKQRRNALIDDLLTSLSPHQNQI